MNLSSIDSSSAEVNSTESNGSVETLLFITCLIIIWQISHLLFNFYAIASYAFSPLWQNVTAVLFSGGLSVAAYFSFLKWSESRCIKIAGKVSISFLILFVAAKSLGLDVLLKSSAFLQTSSLLEFRTPLAIVVLLIFVYFLSLFYKEPFPWRALYSQRFLKLALLFLAIKVLTVFTGPGYIAQEPRFALYSVAENFQREYRASYVNLDKINKDIRIFETLYGGGSKRAAVHLGILNEEKGDLTEAETWYWRAVQAKKHVTSVDSSETPDDHGENTALEVYRRAALGDNAVLLYLYAVLAERGSDPERSVFWYEQAAKAGRQDAIKKLADYYWAGKLVSRDIKKSCEWMALSEGGIVLQIRRSLVCHFSGFEGT